MVAALALVPLAAFDDRLPDPVASHWGGAGSADAHMTIRSVWVSVIILVALCVVGFIAVAVFGRVRLPMGPIAALVPGIIGSVAVALSIGIVAPSLDRTTWIDTPGPSGLTIAAVLVPMFLIPAAASWLAVAIGVPRSASSVP